jgi:hypothetical protein
MAIKLAVLPFSEPAPPSPWISRERPSLDLGFFEFAHDVRVRGQCLLGALIGLPVALPWNPSWAARS